MPLPSHKQSSSAIIDTFNGLVDCQLFESAASVVLETVTDETWDADVRAEVLAHVLKFLDEKGEPVEPGIVPSGALGYAIERATLSYVANLEAERGMRRGIVRVSRGQNDPATEEEEQDLDAKFSLPAEMVNVLIMLWDGDWQRLLQGIRLHRAYLREAADDFPRLEDIEPPPE
ncbi:MAG TPA: hypothetical protein VGP76_03425 [Planctomycetaceae bacterium]|jgi:hypothetical protein|nr:hypothetical protein [Planctomycetaceae bacterium]